MLTENGRVIAVEPGGLWVETVRRSTCGACSAQKGCGHGILNRMTDGKRGYIRVLPGEQSIQDYRVDDEVRFSIPEEVILRGSIVAYLVPIVGLLVGATGAAAWLPQIENSAALLGAVGGFIFGLGLVRWHAVRHHDDPAYQPLLQGRVMAVAPDYSQV
ncbi:SoxR reducing system RseC family protein [Halioglobus sp.]|nr:SoxR reducing system RseC family protein [Halioglobus sp.]